LLRTPHAKELTTARNSINFQGLQMSGAHVVQVLSNEKDFNVLILRGGKDRTPPKNALDIACTHLHVSIVQQLLKVMKSKAQKLHAVAVVEGIITNIVVENELSTLMMHQSDAIRAPPTGTGRTKNKNMKKNGKMKKMRGGAAASKQNELKYEYEEPAGKETILNAQVDRV